MNEMKIVLTNLSLNCVYNKTKAYSVCFQTIENVTFIRILIPHNGIFLREVMSEITFASQTLSGE